MIIQKRLDDQDLTKAWLGRQLGKTGESITSWSKDTQPALDTAMQAINQLSATPKEQTQMLKEVFDALKENKK